MREKFSQHLCNFCSCCNFHFSRREILNNEENSYRSKVFTFSILILVLVISPIIILLVRNAMFTIQNFAGNLVDKTIELRKEKKKSDRLLFEMLPPAVVMQLRQQRQVCNQCFFLLLLYFFADWTLNNKMS